MAVAPVVGPGAVTRLSVVVPAYREAARIGAAVGALRTELAEASRVEIVVVDDGSDDGTAEAARAAAADVVVRLPENRGKGAALRAGVLASSGRVIAFTDADLAYPPRQIQRLLAEAEAGADVVIGNRRHPRSTAAVRPTALRSLGSRVVSASVMVLGLGRCRDTQCGFKAFRRDAAEALFSASVVDGFAFDVELLYLAHRRGLEVLEVPVEVVSTNTSTVRVLSDGLGLVRDLIRIRFRAFLGRYRLP